MLHFVDQGLDAKHLKSEISNLKSLSESCSRQIRAWANSLQNTEIKGQRHLTDATRAQYDYKRRAEEFDRHLQEILHKAHPEIYREPNQED